ncbi:hypothetical protein [Cardiobacterium hominis]|uniref:hypothetical protein n=1 Tax=Cardiobacterium hominis TaxID=2718 RepID=UPI0028E37200|nr:hypothetical protein [Cardiobacterium hominis]
MAQQAAADYISTGSVTLTYGGRRIIPTPGELLFDRVLSDGEKICWMALRALCENITQLPDQQVLADTLGKNRSSISSHLKMLRATRWLIFSETVRQNNLPTRQTYVIYDNPLPLLEAVNLDQYYLDFIISEAEQGKPSRLRDYCRNFVLSLNGDTLLELETFGLRNKLVQASWYSPMTSPDAENSDNGETSDAEKSDNGQSPDAENSNNGETSDAEKSNNGETSDAEKSDNEESPDAENSNNGETSDAEKSNNGETSVVGNSDSGESSVVGNSDSEESSVVGNSDSGENCGDIYNRAHTHARTEPRAGAPTQIGIKSSGRRFNQTSNHPDGWGCGGRKTETGDANGSPFAFLDALPLSRLIPHLQTRYGNKTTHALLNRLKAGSYTFRGESFYHRVDADEAAVVLMSLLDREVHAPLNFVDGLIHRAAQGNLTFQGGQYQRFQTLTADPDRDEKPVTPAVPELPDGTRLIGRSGTHYCITNRCLINEATGTHGGSRADGVHPFRVQSIEEIAGLVQAGCLRIVTGGEE